MRAPVYIGFGAFAREIIELYQLSDINKATYIDNRDYKVGTKVGCFSDLDGPDLRLASAEFVFSVGAIDSKSMEFRSNLIKTVEATNGRVKTLISPDAVVASSANIGAGCVVGRQAIVSVGAQLGAYSVVNCNAFLGHDVNIARNVVIGPGAVVNGGVKIARDSLIGAGACVLQGISIGPGAMIGAGTVVTKDVQAKEIVAPPRMIILNGDFR